MCQVIEIVGESSVPGCGHHGPRAQTGDSTLWLALKHMAQLGL